MIHESGRVDLGDTSRSKGLVDWGACYGLVDSTIDCKSLCGPHGHSCASGFVDLKGEPTGKISSEVYDVLTIYRSGYVDGVHLVNDFEGRVLRAYQPPEWTGSDHCVIPLVNVSL